MNTVTQNMLFRQALRDFINRLKEMLGSMKALTTECAILEKCVDDLEQIQKLWDKAVTSGIKTLNATKSEQKNNTDTEGGVRYLARDNDSSIKQQLIDNLELLNSMDIVASYDVDYSFNGLQETKQWAVDQLKKENGIVSREGLGNVVLDKKRIKKGLSYLKTPEEVASFIAVPDIIRYGAEIGRHNKHKGRVYDTVTFAGPVEINGQRGNVAVVIRIEENNYYKVHRIISTNGSQFVLKTKKDIAETAGGVNENSSLSPTDNVSITIISSTNKKVNEDTTKFSMRDTEYMKAVENDDMETAQRLVDEVAKANGYNSPILYHGTKSFGFTEFDLNKMDDGRSIFLTDSKRIASTYSGVEGTRKISENYDFDIDNMSPKNVVSKLNLLMDKLHKEDYEYAKYQYIDTEIVDKLSDTISKDIDYLKNVVSKKKIEYKNDGKIYSQLSQLYSKLDNRQYTNLSTPIYMLLHHTDVFENDNKNKIAEIEKNIRIFNKVELIDVSDGVILKDMLDGYSLDIIYNKQAKEELEALTLQGNYSMYGNLDGALVLDAKGAYWNNIRNWISNVRLDYNNTEVARENDEFFYLIDKRIGEAIPESWLDVNEHTKKMSKNELQSIMLNKANNILHIRTENVRTTRDIAKFAQDHGYSGVVFNNLADNGGQNTKIDNDDCLFHFSFSGLPQLLTKSPQRLAFK